MRRGGRGVSAAIRHGLPRGAAGAIAGHPPRPALPSATTSTREDCPLPRPPPRRPAAPPSTPWPAASFPRAPHSSASVHTFGGTPPPPPPPAVAAVLGTDPRRHPPPLPPLPPQPHLERDDVVVVGELARGRGEAQVGRPGPVRGQRQALEGRAGRKGAVPRRVHLDPHLHHDTAATATTQNRPPSKSGVRSVRVCASWLFTSLLHGARAGHS